jgi:hypothetical protein
LAKFLKTFFWKFFLQFFWEIIFEIFLRIFLLDLFRKNAERSEAFGECSKIEDKNKYKYKFFMASKTKHVIT